MLAEPFVEGDARHMDSILDNSVALVVTSPPYFAGKQYEEELEREGVPASYLEYLDMLREVFAECVRKLEPGGRIAVNVANLGRKPYRSLSADVIRILQDDLKLLLRGEVIWRKGEGAAGNCAWGSFRKAANPVVRDITERVIIASKGRFDRAKGRPEREPWACRRRARSTPTSSWPPRSTSGTSRPRARASRTRAVPGRAAGAPDPALHLRRRSRARPVHGFGIDARGGPRLDRRYVGYDLDPTYVDIARLRVRDEGDTTAVPVIEHETPMPEPDGDSVDFQARASREGKAAQALAEELLKETGFTIVAKNQRVRGTGVVINFIATDADDVEWYFDVSGAFTSTRGGLLRTDTVWKSLGRAHVLAQNVKGPIVFLTSHAPRPGSEGDIALRKSDDIVYDVIEMRTTEGYEKLRKYAAGGHT